MEVIILENADAVADYGAGRITRLLQENPASVLGLATGRTPVALYERLVSAYRAGSISFKNVITFNLDEYVGLDADDPQSFSYFMWRNLFDHVDCEPGNTYIPACAAGVDSKQVGNDYERSIGRAGGIELQILGIGRNGHIGFNEPTSSLASRTRVKTLARSTMAVNGLSPGGNGEPPRLAVTMGIGTILDAGRLLLLASGDAKAEAVKAAIEGPVSSMCPASALQMHAAATVVIDDAAASMLQLKDYFLEVQQEQRRLDSRHASPAR